MFIIKNLIHGKFVERPNRFVVIFKIENGTTQIAHLRDPGRLKELLIPGVELLLRKALPNPKRKTKYDVIAVFNQNIWVLINSGFHSDIADELIKSGLIKELSDYSIQRREYTYGKSRIDFILTKNNQIKMLLEVKGCTLVEDGLAKFPDAPTLRGTKHLGELSNSLDDGFNATVLFLILREDVDKFSPNQLMDPDFSEALMKAQEKGVNIIAYSFKNIFKNNSLHIEPFKRISIRLDLRL
ncbi:DNA/RNA nuclease SfsA [Methanobacterium sp.]|uniref:DNA/RNA nuclease SfsA n=1 Tax=Methanobacterium sp. TaxID=2164 RepID=UPI003C72F167